VPLRSVARGEHVPHTALQERPTALVGDDHFRADVGLEFASSLDVGSNGDRRLELLAHGRRLLLDLQPAHTPWRGPFRGSPGPSVTARTGTACTQRTEPGPFGSGAAVRGSSGPLSLDYGASAAQKPATLPCAPTSGWRRNEAPGCAAKSTRPAVRKTSPPGSCTRDATPVA
jgi:hypothetical protein